MMRFALCTLCFACTSSVDSPSDSADPIRPPGAGTGTVAALLCTDPGHPLRRTCTADLAEAAAVTWTWDDGEGNSGSALTPSGTRHEVFVSLLVPDAVYEIEGVDDSGTVVAKGAFDADGLPESLLLSFDISGQPGAPFVVFPFGCHDAQSLLVVARTDGVVVGYEDLATAFGFTGKRPIRGLTATEEGTFLVLVGNDVVAEVDFARGIVASFSAEAGTLPAVVHHDVLRSDGVLWALTAEARSFAGSSYVMDGVIGLDAAGGVVASWNVADVLTPTGDGAAGGYWGERFPGAIDFVHANSLAVDDDGGFLVSLHKEDAVLRLDKDFVYDWLLVGNPASALAPGDVVLASGGAIVPTFSGQHHVWSPEPGLLWMLDNEGAADGARVLGFAIDGASATAIDERQSGLNCPGQGNASRLENGNAWVDCSESATFVELEPGGATVFSMTPSCSYGEPSDETLYRALPF